MKRLLAVFLLLAATSSFAQFRDTTWGMTPEEVITSEGGREPFYVSRTPDDKRVMFIGYKVEVFGEEVELSYTFDHLCTESKGLMGASYFFPRILYEQVRSYLRREYERNGFYQGLSWWPAFRGPEVSILLESRPYSESETFEVIYAADWWLADPEACFYEFQD